jgi:ankyrin repeat protein
MLRTLLTTWLALGAVATDLTDAINSGDEAEILALLKDDAYVDQDAGGYRALHLAANRGEVEILKMLLNHGATLDATDAGGLTAISHAAFAGRSEAVAFLISKNAMLNTADMSGKTPLYYACEQGNYAAASALLDAGARDDLRSSEGGPMKINADGSKNKESDPSRTPLEIARTKGHSDIVRLLEEHYANNYKDEV